MLKDVLAGVAKLGGNACYSNLAASYFLPGGIGFEKIHLVCGIGFFTMG